MSWLQRRIRVYSAVAQNMVKLMMAYSVWFWVEMFGSILMMMIVFYFWRAVYADTDAVGGMKAQETITYMLFAQILAPLVRWSLILDFGGMIREGAIGIELLRPADFQARFYVQGLTAALVSLVRQALPLGMIAWLFFGLKLPTDPKIWVAFTVTVLVGNAILFFFDWTFASLAFYTTEVWGMHILREGVATFFSGAMIPLAMLPGWLQSVAGALPFGQALYAPIGLLTGIIPLSQLPQVWLGQAIWLVSLGIISRITFNLAARQITVQGG